MGVFKGLHQMSEQQLLRVTEQKRAALDGFIETKHDECEIHHSKHAETQGFTTVTTA